MKLLLWSADNNYENLCILIKNELITLANEEWTNYKYCWMLYHAAEAGHERLCHLAKEWRSDINFNWMLFHAAKGGHKNLCLLAIDWGATQLEYLLIGAASRGHENLCKWAIEEYSDSYSQADIIDHMLLIAKEYGYKDRFK